MSAPDLTKVPIAGAPSAAPPSYEELHRGAAYSSGGKNYVRASNYPNGLVVTVVRTEVLSGFENRGWDAYWVVTSEDNDVNGKNLEGEGYLRETTPIAKKMAALGIESPVGRKFLLTQIEMQGKKTFQIGRAL
jgi:hypothetical protein